ncbi:MAG: hypothetical protein ACM3IL_04650 [Deltaproteobacteria bacterium]
MKSHKNILLAALLFLAAYLFLFRNIIFSRNGLISSYEYGDMFIAEYAHKSLTFSQLRAGQFPLWNPYTFCGYPWFANPANQMSYPLNFIFLFLPVNVAINYSFMLHILIAGLGMYLFVASILKDKFPALISALVFMFSPVFFLRCFAGHLTVVHAYSWIPFIFFTADLFLRKRKGIYVLLTALFLGLQLLTGHSQTCFYTLLGICLYFIFFSIADYRQNRDKRALFYRAKSLAFILALAAGIAAVKIIPNIELTRLSNRSIPDPAFVGFFSFPPSNFITYLLPEFFGDGLNVPYWGSYNLWEMCGYVGILPLVLGITSVLCKRNRYTVFFSFLAVLGILGSLGSHTFLFKLFYYFLPGYNKFRGHSKFLILFFFSIAILSAYGVSWLLGKKEGQNQRLNRLVVILGYCTIFAVLCVSYLFLNYRQAVLAWLNLWRDMNWPVAFAFSKFACAFFSFIKMTLFVTASFLLLWFWAKGRITLKVLKVFLTLIIIADLWLFGAKYLVYDKVEKSYWDKDIAGFLKNRPGFGLYRVETIPFFSKILADNNAILEKISVFSGYDHLTLKRYDSFANYYFSKPPGDPQFLKVAGMANLKYLIYPSYAQLANPGLKAVYQKYDLRIWENADCLPRAYIVHNTRVIEGGQDDKILSVIFEDGSFDPKTTVILEKETLGATDTAESAVTNDETVIVKKYSANEVVIQAELARNGFLVLSDVNYPGWQATVLDTTTGNRRPAEVLNADYLFRAVGLKKGSYVVTFVFRPRSLYLGVTVSALTVLLILITCLGYIRKRAAA